jgi:chaperonin GroEL
VENKIGNCLIVAENVEVDALSTFILNKVKGAMNFCVVKAPGMGDAKEDNYKDICAVTGAELIDPTVGDWQNKLGMNTLGAAEQVIVTNDETVIIGGQGELVDVRADVLAERLKKAKLDEKEEIKDRIARLKGKVGIIKVGGTTDTEAEEKKYRIDDAVAAVRAALKDGIVPGGGVTLRDISFDVFSKDTDNKVLQALGVSLCALYDTLLRNSGYDPTTKYAEGRGINVLTGEMVDVLEAGIIDPAKVTEDVVRNAITTACLAITVGGAIVDTQLSQDEMLKLMNGGQ